MVVNAVILVSVAKAKVDDIAQGILKIEGVREVFSVAGRYDLVVIVRVQSNEAVADIVTHALQSIEGIEQTETMLAFKSYREQDLEGMFSIGNDGP